MTAHWTALFVGVAVGAALGWWMGSKPVGKSSTLVGGAGITGTQNAPFQRFITRS